jgi:hypothetical protein
MAMTSISLDSCTGLRPAYKPEAADHRLAALTWMMYHCTSSRLTYNLKATASPKIALKLRPGESKEEAEGVLELKGSNEHHELESNKGKDVDNNCTNENKAEIQDSNKHDDKYAMLKLMQMLRLQCRNLGSRQNTKVDSDDSRVERSGG